MTNVQEDAMTSQQATISQLWGIQGQGRIDTHTNPNNNRQQTNNRSRQNNASQLKSRSNYTNQMNNDHASLQQQRLTKSMSVDEWGDKLTAKSDSVFRLGCCNIKGLPIAARHPKNEEIYRDISTNKFDLFGMSKTNLVWHALPDQDRLQERLRGRFEFHNKSYSYNANYSTREQFQYGGTLSIAQGSCCGRIVKVGSDPCQLGRWNWVLMRGRNQKLIRIITVYRPVVSHGATSTYQQHRQFFNTKSINKCPRQML